MPETITDDIRRREITPELDGSVTIRDYIQEYSAFIIDRDNKHSHEPCKFER